MMDAAPDPTVVPPATTTVHPPTGRIRQIWRALQVRLRFLVILGTAFLVVGMWGYLRNVWDTWRHRWTGGAPNALTVSADTEYFCPMCPGVVSDWPAICPVCSMDLIRRKKGDAQVLPEGVVARMQLSPYRVQLAGIATSAIEQRPLQLEIPVAGRLMAPPPSTTADTTDKPPALELACAVSHTDLTLLAAPREARVTLEGDGRQAQLVGQLQDAASSDATPGVSGSATVRIRLPALPDWARAGTYGTAVILVPVTELESAAHRRPQPTSESKTQSADGVLAVPETAVVDTGTRRVVFVETMPGMFDGVEVTLGPRCGDYYPVRRGLAVGQKVATIGAFLIDAEARLSPDLAASYFGAARTADSPASPSSQSKVTGGATARRSKKSRAAKLSPADEKLARAQKICPVTEADLDSMGGPIAVEVAGRRVFICCQGCEGPLKADPQKYLARLGHDPATP